MSKNEPNVSKENKPKPKAPKIPLLWEKKRDIPLTAAERIAMRSIQKSSHGAEIYTLLLCAPMCSSEIYEALGSKHIKAYITKFEEAGFIDHKEPTITKYDGLIKSLESSEKKDRKERKLEREKIRILGTGERLGFDKAYFRATLRPFLIYINSFRIAKTLMTGSMPPHVEMDDISRLWNTMQASNWSQDLSKEEEKTLIQLWEERLKDSTEYLITQIRHTFGYHKAMKSKTSPFELLRTYFIRRLERYFLENTRMIKDDATLNDEENKRQRDIRLKILLLLYCMNYRPMYFLAASLIPDE